MTSNIVHYLESKYLQDSECWIKLFSPPVAVELKNRFNDEKSDITFPHFVVRELDKLSNNSKDYDTQPYAKRWLEIICCEWINSLPNKRIQESPTHNTTLFRITAIPNNPIDLYQERDTKGYEFEFIEQIVVSLVEHEMKSNKYKDIEACLKEFNTVLRVELENLVTISDDNDETDSEATPVPTKIGWPKARLLKAIETTNECSICSNPIHDYEKLYITPCMHIFHYDCSMGYQHIGSICSICRT
jgi:hypothetical protein